MKWSPLIWFVQDSIIIPLLVTFLAICFHFLTSTQFLPNIRILIVVQEVILRT